MKKTPSNLFRLFLLFPILLDRLGIPDRIVIFVHQFGGRIIFWRMRDMWFWKYPLVDEKPKYNLAS